MGTNSFFLELTAFQKGLYVQESKQEVTKVASLVKMVENGTSVFRSLKFTVNFPCFFLFPVTMRSKRTRRS